MSGHPVLMHTVLDATDARGLAEFYRELLGLRYRPGDDPAAEGGHDSADEEADWLVLVDGVGRRQLAFQKVDALPPATWPDPGVPMQLHVDLRVPTADALRRHREHAERLGATLLHDRYDDPEEPLYVLADPAGHPFCLLVSSG